MMEKSIKQENNKFNIPEFKLPETIYSRDIENKVFQGIIIKSLSQISGISLIEGNFLDTLIGRMDRVKGIYTEQDTKNHAVKVRVELNICYGVSIPQKSEEIQVKITDQITQLTGLRVSEIHIVFKELVASEDNIGQIPPLKKKVPTPEDVASAFGADFDEEGAF